MSDNKEVKPAEQDNGEIVLDLNFAPSWARSSPEAHIKRLQNERYDDDFADQRSHRNEPGDRYERRPKRRDFADAPRRSFDRKSQRRGGERSKDAEMRRPDSRGAFADLKADTPAPTPAPQHGGERRRRQGEYRPARQEVPQLPLEIRVLPEQKALGAVIRRIQTSHRAFPLRDIAWLFLDNPASCLIRIEAAKDQQLPLFQCKVCGMPALSEEDVRAHLMSRHMEDYFDVEEVDCEPPTGSFVCVAKCGLSGVLLGPPNHHAFNTKVNEMLRTRYAGMSEENYRARIESIRDPEVIEQWRQQCTKKLIYRRKGVAEPVALDEPPAAADGEAPEGAVAQGEVVEEEAPPRPPPMERDIAELVFTREIVPAQIASVRHMVCTAAVAMQTPSRPLYFALKDMLQRERRFPASLFFALRGAFRHRKLHLFRVNDARGPDFVMLRQAVVLDPAHTVQTLREILTYIAENPACTKTEMVKALADGDEEKIKEVLVQLAWLVEKGHVIEYYNEVLSVPQEYPVFRLLPGEKQSGGRKGEAPAHRAKKPAASDAAAKPSSDAQAPAAAEGDAVATAESDTTVTAEDDVPTATEGDASAVAKDDAPAAADAADGETKAVAENDTSAVAAAESDDTVSADTAEGDASAAVEDDASSVTDQDTPPVD
jgi:hypothetical protein